MPAKHVVLDEFHLKVFVPTALPKEQADAMTRVLLTSAFQKRLQRSVAAACRRHKTLSKAVVRVTH